MKKTITFILLVLTAVMTWAQVPLPIHQCDIVITGDFDSECIYDFKDEVTDEYPNLMIACKGSTVTYTAYADMGTATPTGYIWEIYGDVTHTATGNSVVVEWGNDEWGYVVVSVVGDNNDTCTGFSRVKLIDNPVVGSTTVPSYTTMSNGHKVIQICRGESVQFIDQSTAGNSDIAGYVWSFSQGGQASTSDFLLEDIQRAGVVTHRVYNNCGCYDEETYEIELLRGATLELDCYGTVCKDAIVTYTATSPTCTDYQWYVDGGTIIRGQGTATPTVQWDNPTDGYGVIGLDGYQCGETVCPTVMSKKVPVIHGGIAIDGQTDVCLGETVLFSLPLFGSTEYQWKIIPSTGIDTSMKTRSNETRFVFNQQGTYKLACQYYCDFLNCGPYHADTLTITVKPKLDIVGADKICISHACNLQTSPSESVSWTAYDMGNGNAVAVTVTGTTFAHTFLHPGRYLVTAAHPDYCTEATFVLEVKDTPPAPTVADLDFRNRHTACIYSGIALAGTPSQPSYDLVWEPSCTTASPQSVPGDSVTIMYQGEVCDVHVYNYDRVLQCRSSNYYIHQVTRLLPAPLNIPANITVCPGSTIVWGDDEVPDQSGEGMLYEWSIEPAKQNCASVQGSHFSNSIVLSVNEVSPTTFYVKLRRTYCGSIHDDTIINITISNMLANLTIGGPDSVCLNDEAVYHGAGGNAASYEWTAEYSGAVGETFTHAFSQSGYRSVTLRGHGYTYCTNTNSLTSTTKNVFVEALPNVSKISYSGSNGLLYLSPDPGTVGYSFTWWYQDYYDDYPHYVTGTNTYQIPSPLVTSHYYYCTVTDNATGCSKTVSCHYQPGTLPNDGCDTMHFTQYYDYCNNIMTLVASNYQSNVMWQVPSGCHVVGYYGYHNREVHIRFDDIGVYNITASSGFGNPCYKGTYVKTVDFVHDFSFSPQCDRITVVNNSHHLPSTNNVYIQVTNNCNSDVDIISMSVGSPSHTYVPTTPPTGLCQYTFSMVGYGTNGNINPPCPLGEVTIGSPSGSHALTIETGNTNYQNRTCDNTPISLTAHLPYPGPITHSFWTFGDASTLGVKGSTIYHTFEAPGTYYVTVSATDNYGCVRTTSAPFIIQSFANYFGHLIDIMSPTVCPNATIPIVIEYTAAGGIYYDWWRLKDLTRIQTVVNIYPTYRTDDYFVYVINDNYCQREASTFVEFLNAPTAFIFAERFNCCEGNSIILYGEQLSGDDPLSYLWNITGPNGYSQTYSTPNVTFTAPAVTGTYNVTLTVTDVNTTCSSTATETITVNAKPAAPTLAFSGSPCISDAPVTIAATGFTGEMHWSNGLTGATSDFYTHGMVSGYYYDPAIGCASDTATIRIDRQPDFEAMLSGCYPKCKSFFDYYLPLYGFTDSGQEIDWDWQRNGISVATGHGDYSDTPLLLPLTGLGTYQMQVDYAGGNCSETSPELAIGIKETCDCDSVSVTYIRRMDAGNCKLLYTVEVTICNNNIDDDFCADKLKLALDHPNVKIVSTDFTPTTIHPNNCYTFSIVIEVLSLEPSVATFVVKDENCLFCDLTFSMDLMPEIDCVMPMRFDVIRVNDLLSSRAAAYFDFRCLVGSTQSVLAFWTEPPMVINYLYDGISAVSGLGMIDMAVLSQMLYNGSNICFYAIVCSNGILCKLEACISAADLYDMIIHAGVTPGFRNGDKSKSGDDGAVGETASPSLVPNPTSGEVRVDGNHGDIVEIVVMDMNGRHVVSFTETYTFNVHDLPSGSYIVRVRTKESKGECDVSYLKLIKE